MQDPWQDAHLVTPDEKRAMAALVAEALRHDPDAVKVEVDGRTFYDPKPGPDIYLVGLRLDDSRWACVALRPMKAAVHPKGQTLRESVAVVLERQDLAAAPLKVELRDDIETGVSA